MAVKRNTNLRELIEICDGAIRRCDVLEQECACSPDPKKRVQTKDYAALRDKVHEVKAKARHLYGVTDVT